MYMCFIYNTNIHTYTDVKLSKKSKIKTRNLLMIDLRFSLTTCPQTPITETIDIIHIFRYAHTDF